MSVPRSSPLDCSISWSIFLIVFELFVPQHQTIYWRLADLILKPFANVPFLLANGIEVFRASEFLNKSNSDCAKRLLLVEYL